MITGYVSTLLFILKMALGGIRCILQYHNFQIFWECMPSDPPPPHKPLKILKSPLNWDLAASNLSVIDVLLSIFFQATMACIRVLQRSCPGLIPSFPSACFRSQLELMFMNVSHCTTFCSEKMAYRTVRCTSFS